MPESKPVGVWIRVSTEDQARGDSPEHHEARARAYAEGKGWKVTTLYNLAGWSGKTVKDHPECRRMMHDVAAGRISALIFSKLARVARNTRELLDFREFFKEHEADMVALDNNIDTSTPSGRMFYTFTAAQAEWEREEIAERVAASVPIRAKLGKLLGGSAPYGYRFQDKKLVIDEVEAPIRRLMYELFLEHRRKKTVARILNERGFRTRPRKGKSGRWSDTTVLRLLTDPIAKGLKRVNYSKSVNNKKAWKLKPESDWVWREVPAIVSVDVWEQCNAILAERRKGKKPPGPRPKHLFTGVVYCHCGTRMYVRWKGRVYECAKCKNKVPTADLETVFQEQLRNLVVEPQAITEYLDGADAQIAEKTALVATQEAEAARLSERMDSLLDLFLAKKLTKDDFGERYQPLEARREEIRRELPRLQGELDALKLSRASTDQIVKEASDLHTHWPQLLPDEKRRIVEQLAERITIGTGEIEIDLAFRPTQAQPETASERQSTHRVALPFCIVRFRACKPTRYAPGLVATRLPNPPRTLGDHLLVARFDRGLRQEDVARELGVDQFTLGNWEKGKTSPVIRHRPSIYEWLGFCPVEPTPTSIGPRLVAWRKAQGLSQQQVAERLGLDPGTLSRTEQGKLGSPNRRVRRAIEALLRMSGAYAAPPQPANGVLDCGPKR